MLVHKDTSHNVDQSQWLLHHLKAVFLDFVQEVQQVSFICS